jgi:hypothetical protein
MMKTLVIAGNYDQANIWMHARQKRTVTHTVVHNADQLRGMRNPNGIFIGTWRNRKDIFEILNMLLVQMTDPVKHKIIQDLLVQHIIEKTE